MSWLQHWFAVHTGTVNEPGPFYGFWSGFGSDLAELTAPLVVLFGLWKAHNCHAHRCLRIGRHDYEIDGVVHKLCRHCHPLLKGQRHTREAIHAYHAAK